MANCLIKTIKILPLGMLNAYLLIENDTVILVDTGLPNSEKRIENALRANGLNWADVKLIILTHGHIDHAGSASKLGKLSSAPILAHKEEVPYLKGRSPTLRPTGTFGRLFQKTGAILRPFTYFKPDIVMTEAEYCLKEFGLSGRVIHTPGHTPGSLSVQLKDDDVIAGDLIASGILLGGIIFKDRPKPPPFEEDRDLVKHSLQNLLDSGCKRFFLGHGGPINDLHVRKYIQE